jgi:site-specific recombinase XerC
MPKIVNLDKVSGADLQKMGPFLFVIDGPGKKEATLFYQEDYKEIVDILKKRGVTDRKYLEESYWRNYLCSCRRVFNAQKVVNQYKSSKRAYFQKWRTKKMTTCHKNARCPEDMKCVPVRASIFGYYGCGCRK